MAQAPFAINPALSAIAIDFASQNLVSRGFIADQVLPRVKVDAPLFRYPTYPIGEAFTLYDTAVGRTSELNEINQSANEATGAVIDHGLKSGVPFRDILAQQNQSIPMDVKARAVMDVISKVMLAREVRAATLLFTAGNYATGYKATLAGTGQWSDLVNSDPIAAITDAITVMTVKPNTLVLGQLVANMVRRHPKTSQALGGSQTTGRYVPLQEVADLLGLERIIVGNTLTQLSKRGQPTVTDRVWGKSAALLNIPATGADGYVTSPGDPAFALTFQFGDKVAGEILAPNMGLLGGVYVKAGEMISEQLVAQEAGYLFTNAVA